MGLFRWAGMGAAAGPMDRWLLAAVLLLALWGLLMVYSSSSAMGIVSHGGNDLFYLENQLAKGILGVALMLGLSRIDAQHYARRVPWIFWGLGLAALLLLLIPQGPGVEVRGTRRWLSIGGVLVQPAEFARVAMIVCLAAAVATRRGELRTWRGLALPLGIVFATAGLIAVQPHLSMAALTALSGLLLLFLAGGRPWKLGLAGGGAALLAFLVKRGYQGTRIDIFLEGLRGDPTYQVHQSILGIGSGGLTGMGLGRGMQKHFFLPDPHTDFILSIVGEELGLLGLLLLSSLTALIILRIFVIGRRSGVVFGELVAYGVGLQFLLAFLLHTAVCVGWAPTTGVPYPLMSFGGSALLASLTAIGIVLAVSRRSPGVRRPSYMGRLLMDEPTLGRSRS
ncbi:MAG: FtsW/RodA/SpoVE family cell cycle protein [Candidatus Eisenbacteria bacterium]|uniref:Probable peptidoglycan glycosyltransferase FtsW n=1 Tax=Eiseniibacteriota bacterium TaxID=2212470 RepID=A0A937XAX3_UNCEI|nr:FtsW/RodA/SpoVE family cell cycle protein [Candidatus Eisenbacteria bacterium]